MQAIQYVKSVPRFLAARTFGSRWEGVYTSRLGTIQLATLTPPPLPSAQWVRVRPLLSGICGSDLATITARGSAYFSPFTSCPFVLGHEVVGEVTEAGPEVEGFPLGARVVLQPPLHCRVRGIESICPECGNGRPAHCLNIVRGNISAGVQTGFCRDTGGGWSQGFVAHQLQLRLVPQPLSDEAAVLIEPFSCCLQAVLSASVQNQHTVIVIGSGTIGALTIAALRATGSRCRLIAVAKYPHQQEIARSLGADLVIGTGKDFFAEMTETVGAERFQPEFGPPVVLGGADCVFDCIGSSRSIDDSLRFTRNRGNVVLVGMPGVPSGVDWTSIWYKELRVVGSYTSAGQTFEQSIELMSGLAPRLEPMITARFPLRQYRQAVSAALNAGREQILKTTFEP